MIGDKSMFRLYYIDRYGSARIQEGINDIKDLCDIVMGISDQGSVAKTVYNWACQAHFGDVLDIGAMMKVTCYSESRRHEEHSKVLSIKDAVGELNYHRETSVKIYGDNIWEAFAEKTSNGTIRFWVSYNYKDGQHNSSLFTVYRVGNELKTACQFKVPKAVEEKILRVYRRLPVD